VDIVYIDFAKAFDTVPHRLLKKLESYGVYGNLLGWIRVSGGQETAGDGRCSILSVGQSVEWSSSRVSVGSNSVRLLHQ